MIPALSKDVLYEDEELLMQIRLFSKACDAWGKTPLECSEIFDRYDVDGYIKDCYDLFHVQGDEVNLQEITDYVVSKGECI